MNYERYLTESSEQEAKPKAKGLWDLLSTMKFAIWILVALGALSLMAMFAGELMDPEAMARSAESGGQSFGNALLTLFQMDNPFRSWWYRGLLGVLCLSLVACILERLPVIWRLWSKQPPRTADWLRSISYGVKREVIAPREEVAKHIGHWTWRVKTDALWIGESGRLAMWGPLFTHVGLLLLGVGALAGSFGGLTTRTGGFPGEIAEVEGLPFAVRIDSFRVIYYPLQPGQWVQVDGRWIGKLEREQTDGSWLVRQSQGPDDDGEAMPVTPDRIRNQFNSDMDRGNIKRYASWVTVLENGQEVSKQEVAVNSPLRHNGYRFYQSSYDPDRPRFIAVYDSLLLSLTGADGAEVATLALRPGVEIPVPGDTLRVTAGNMLPHFKLGQQGPFSESSEFVNPAVNLTFRGPHGFEKTQWTFLRFPSMEAGPGRYGYKLADLHGERASQELMTIFEVKRTHGGWILWLGFLIGSLGMLLSAYVFHRVLYVEWPEAGRPETRLTGLSRKTSALFARQLDRTLETLNRQTAS